MAGLTFLQLRLHVLCVLLVIYALPTYAAKEIECYTFDHSPSPFIPELNDCVQLANNIFTSPSSGKQVIFSDRPVPASYIKIPRSYFFNSCYMSIEPEGEPYYDISSWQQIAQTVNNTAHDCLSHVSHGSHGFGGRSPSGVNKWLWIYVTGLIVGRTSIDLSGQEVDSLSILNNSTSTVVDQMNSATQ
ncbi:uncharacterized protein KY384_008952 [Bacidia gigantensis]|uniref:uncharacterized protein n=1 Tax=Bacidia gigantensis TaxID=2732470 RepID=UPI001D04E96E|nr:uncharacterized protein KY384_008952 [Bacidia gigantensis]KAG8525308.1 hypothetical protein KY384_008952 [Bacidia gigantensis]